MADARTHSAGLTIAERHAIDRPERDAYTYAGADTARHAGSDASPK
jgi:hypothetical protein